MVQSVFKQFRFMHINHYLGYSVRPANESTSTNRIADGWRNNHSKRKPACSERSRGVPQGKARSPGLR